MTATAQVQGYRSYTFERDLDVSALGRKVKFVKKGWDICLTDRERAEVEALSPGATRFDMKGDPDCRDFAPKPAR